MGARMMDKKLEWKEAMWLGIPMSEKRRWNILHGDLNGRYAYYRCVVESGEIDKAVINITANSRYRLWVNSHSVLSGPCKGDRNRQYYETVDITRYMKTGKNILAVQVLFCDPNAVSHQYQERAPIFAVSSLPAGHLLAVEGKVYGKGKDVDLTTGKAPWRVYLDGSFYLISDEITMNLGAVLENIDFRKHPLGWKTEQYDSKGWAEPLRWGLVKADGLMEKVGLYGAFRIQEREIPLLYEEQQLFTEKCNPELLVREKCMLIKPDSCQKIILDAEKHTNAYLKFQFSKGIGAKVRITYSEKYSAAGSEIKRTDYKNGELRGETHQIILPGQLFTYEPFWVKTFRLICIEVQTAKEEVQLYLPQMYRTGYPLMIESTIKSSIIWIERLWDMCIRTLQNCMMETYMDCPFYEQMQFIMDTRLQALFTYSVSSDVRLVKKALKDFHYSMIPDGLIQGKYPSAFPQIISTFSLHFIYMVEEYYLHTKDITELLRYRVDVDSILSYYELHMGKEGLVEHLGYWQFVDWQEAWRDNMGVPTAALTGPSTIINLMYAYALKCGARINEITGRYGMAEEYTRRQQNVLIQVQKLCWDEKNGLYKEGPDTDEYSQHAQAWAILNRMVTKKEGSIILKKTLDYPNILPCSFSTSYELFRAFEWVGDYYLTQGFMEKWKRLIEWDCTTCPEEPENGRSECHAWSALPLFEFSRSIAGIKMGSPGWETVLIQPNLDYADDIAGSVVTPRGNINFDFCKCEGRYRVNIPKGLTGEFIMPDGCRKPIGEGVTVLECV